MSELARKHKVDVEKLRPIAERVIADQAFANQFFEHPDQALAAYRDLTPNEVAVLKGLNRKLIDVALAGAAEALVKEGADVEGQSQSGATQRRGADVAVGRAFLETLGGQSTGGHWNAGVGMITACCGWNSVFG